MSTDKLPPFSSDPEPTIPGLRHSGAIALMALGALVAGVVCAGIWYRTTTEPPTLTAQLAADSANKERLHERYVLLSQLPTDTVEVSCVPVPGYHLLDCKVVRAGLESLKIVHINVPLSKQLPLVRIDFEVGTRDNYTLRYSKVLAREERLAIIRGIKLDID